MDKYIAVVVILFSNLIVVSGLSLTCDSYLPTEGSDVVCSCVSDQNIEWFNGSSVISTCVTTGVCLPLPSDYSFSFNSDGSHYIYNITILSFNFYHCGFYGCRNYGEASGSSLEVGILSEFDNNTPPDAIEPSPGNDGNVTVTTSCMSPSPAKGISDVKWYKVNGNSGTSVLSTNIQSSQISCDSSCGFKYKTQYTYTQPMDISNAEEVTLRVTYYTKDGRKLSWTSSNTYILEKELHVGPVG